MTVYVKFYPRHYHSKTLNYCIHPNNDQPYAIVDQGPSAKYPINTAQYDDLFLVTRRVHKFVLLMCHNFEPNIYLEYMKSLLVWTHNYWINIFHMHNIIGDFRWGKSCSAQIFMGVVISLMGLPVGVGSPFVVGDILMDTLRVQKIFFSEHK